MRPIFIAFCIALLFAACNSKSESGKEIVGIDTTGTYKNNMMADTAKTMAVPPPGTVVKKVETHSPDGSVTTTTITSSATKPKAISKVNSSPGTVHTAPVAASPQPVATTTKKGWSDRAKGTVIGGVGGAAVGAAVSKKKGKGAIIGGLAGAAGGYIIGNEKDKKKGR